MVLLEELEKGGCRVEFLDRPMSQDPHDQLLLQIWGAVADEPLRQLRYKSGVAGGSDELTLVRHSRGGTSGER
jgi:hypothetical protein